MPGCIYPIGASVDRVRWSRIDFTADDRVDSIVALARYNRRRRMTKTGRFTPVEPFTAPSPV